MLANLSRPIIFGHRGAPVHAPENTLASFQQALLAGAPAIELDAKLTADQQVVVLHDATLDRTTNGYGQLAAHTLSQVRELDAGGWFSPAFRGEKVPTLADVFDLVRDKALINVELTNYQTTNDALVEKVVELVRQFRLESSVLFSSFNPQNLLRSRRLIPEVPLGFLILEGQAGWFSRNMATRFIAYDALHPSQKDVSPRMVQNQHQRHKLVHVWTVNQPDEISKLVAWEVDGIFTDDPALALRVLKEAG